MTKTEWHCARSPRAGGSRRRHAWVGAPAGRDVQRPLPSAIPGSAIDRGVFGLGLIAVGTRGVHSANDALAHGIQHDLGGAVEIELLHDSCTMRFDRTRAHMQKVSDL